MGVRSPERGGQGLGLGLGLDNISMTSQSIPAELAVNRESKGMHWLAHVVYSFL